MAEAPLETSLPEFANNDSSVNTTIDVTGRNSFDGECSGDMLPEGNDSLSPEIASSDEDEIDEDLPSSKLFVMGDCRICQLCKVEILILPCKHRACGDCAHGVTGCPVCNKPIAEQRDVWAQDNLWQEMVVGYMEEEYEMYDNMAE